LNAAHERLGLVRPVWRLVDRWLRSFSILTTALNSNWWHLGMAGKLPEFLCPPECVGEQDFVGLDYYWGMRSLALNQAHKLADAMAGGYESAPVWPGALYKTLRYVARMFPDQPVIIVENGCVETAGGIDRATYIDKHMREVERAAREGVNIAGYICWSITSNREWGLRFGRASDFGLYYVDLDNDPELKRVSTPAAEAFRRNVARIRELGSMVP
jgi:beta-glucosidase/6-phospho-beta-glucosidase/beta-galactosidase